MTWTYNTALTATKDQVRLEIGDTVSGKTVTLADEEITYAIGAELNLWGAAARCAEMLSRQYLAMADVRVGRGGTQVTYTTAAKQYADMAVALRKKATGVHAPWAGGTSVSDKTTLAADTTLVQPVFTKHMQDNPYVGQQGSDTRDDQDDA